MRLSLGMYGSHPFDVTDMVCACYSGRPVFESVHRKRNKRKGHMS